MPAQYWLPCLLNVGCHVYHKATYGYADSGESFSINDGKEVWIMELIGKGPGETGAVWVAQKLPVRLTLPSDSLHTLLARLYILLRI